MVKTERAAHEIAHGRKLSESGAESVWGWGTPAGKVRFQRRAERIIRLAHLQPGVKALEIGCGTGNFTAAFSTSGADILALDISEDLLAMARQRKLPKTVCFVCRPFESLEGEKRFDAVIGSSVLHHLEIKPALTAIFRLLKPGGIMAFGEPNMANPQIMVEKNVPWIKRRMGDSPDETAFFRGQMRRLLKDAGFGGIEITPLDWLHPAVPEKMIPAVLRIESALERIPLLREISGSLYIRALRPGDGA